MVKVTVTDDEHGKGEREQNVRVHNVVPVVLTAAPTTPVKEGGRAIVEAGPAGVGTPFTAAGTFADPGTQDTFGSGTPDPSDDSTVNYGDDSDPVGLTITGRAFGVPAHHYVEPGDYVASITLKDDDDKGTSPSSTPASKVDVTAVKLNSITVSDVEHPANSVTANLAGTTPNLYVGETPAGNARVRIAAVIAPVDAQTSARRHVLWRVVGDGAAPQLGDFSAAADVTLTPGARTFLVEAGFDDNGNRQIDSGEATRTINVHVLKLRSLTAADASHAAVQATVHTGATGELFVGERAGTADAAIALSADILPADSQPVASRVLWRVDGAGARPGVGHFNAGAGGVRATANVTLTPGHRGFTSMPAST